MPQCAGEIVGMNREQVTDLDVPLVQHSVDGRIDPDPREFEFELALGGSSMISSSQKSNTFWTTLDLEVTVNGSTTPESIFSDCFARPSLPRLASVARLDRIQGVSESEFIGAVA